MRVPVSWLRDYVDLPATMSVTDLAERLTMLGLKLEALEAPGHDVTGPLVVGRVESFESETHSNNKTIRWCQVGVGESTPRGIVCGAANFAEGDLVVVALPGAVLPGGFEIAARKTYGHVSDGMICSARELTVGDDHAGIIVLRPEEGTPGEDAAALLHLYDDVIEFEINPDRAYALSVRGVAREAATAYDLPFTDPAETLPAVTAGEGYPVKVEDSAGCPSFVALEVSGFDPSAPSPRWLARRVQLAGMRPISLAVDATNYVMLELGNPIHGYDKDSLRGPIVVRRAAPGERLQTLDDVTRTLNPDDLLITDDRGPVGLAGVMGGAEVEMGQHTSNIVIEAAHFDPTSVARTARQHKLPSEAARRFERGVDPTLPVVAARRAAELLVRYGGGQVASTATVAGQPQTPAAISMPMRLSTDVAGFAISEQEVEHALRTVGCKVEAGAGELAVTPPPWRPDLTDPNDLAEEVLRIVGYDKIPSVLPAAPAGRGRTKRQRLKRRAEVTAAGRGYVEVLTYPFVGERDWESLGLAADDNRRAAVRVANPISDVEPLLRTTLLPGLLRAAARNVSRGRDDVALFESGLVFRAGEASAAPPLGVDRAPTDSEFQALAATLPDQPWQLGVVLCGSREPAGWWGPARMVSWADAVAVCRDVAAAYGVDVSVRAAQQAPWHPGRCAEILCEGQSVGYAGELHPRVCRSYELPARTAACELDMEALVAAAPDIIEAPKFANYPVGKEDVALVVDQSVPAAEVEATLREGAGELLETVRLFDVYTGEQIPAHSKSLAFSLRFRAPDRTLTDAELNSARDAAVAAAEQRLGARLRT